MRDHRLVLSAHFDGISVEDQIRLVVIGGGVAVDQNQTIAAIVAQHPGRGVDRERGPGHNQHIRFCNGLGRAVHHVGVQ